MARAGAGPGRLVRDSLLVSVGGQIERGLGIITALLLRRWLDPAHLGVYSALRIDLDQTNRSSLGIGLGAVQKIPALRAAGRRDEARHIADVASTATTVTCLLYALGLLAWAFWRRPLVASDPLSAEWTWGLAAIAPMALLQRRLSFQIAVLRARGEFARATELDVFEAVATIVLFGGGIALGGFWGLIAGVALVLAAKLLYIRTRHPLRFRWSWDGAAIVQLMRIGMPIFLATAAFGLLTNLDRVLILWLWPGSESARAVGLYSVAALGAGWGLDAAGRLAPVLATDLLETLGRTGDPGLVARRAARAVELQAPWLAAGAAAGVVAGPALLGAALPRYAEGLPALQPLAPGMTLLALSWPARQALIALGRPYAAAGAALLGALVGGLAAAVGSVRGGLPGVALGMTAGYAVVYAAASWAAFGKAVGRRGFLAHQVSVLRPALGLAVAALLIAELPPLAAPALADAAVRCVLLLAIVAPAISSGVRRSARGGLVEGTEGGCST